MGAGVRGESPGTAVPGLSDPSTFPEAVLVRRRGLGLEGDQFHLQVERLAAAVGKDNLLVLDSADFWAEPDQHWPEVATFLGLSDHPVSIAQHNARSRAPMSDQLRAQLQDHYTPFDERLARWWGRTPSWRR